MKKYRLIETDHKYPVYYIENNETKFYVQTYSASNSIYFSELEKLISSIKKLTTKRNTSGYAEDLKHVLFEFDTIDELVEKYPEYRI